MDLAFELKELLAKAVEAVKENSSAVFFIFSLGTIVSLFFLNWALAFSFIFLLAVGLVIKFRNPSIDELLKEKELTLREIKICEKKFLKRQIDQATHEAIRKERNQELIRIETKIENRLAKEKQERGGFGELEGIEAKKRHVLKELLEKKKDLLKELNLTKKKYFKRRLDKESFSAMVKQKQSELIDVEARIFRLIETSSLSPERIEKVGEEKMLREEQLQERTLERKKRQEKRRKELEELQELEEVSEELIKDFEEKEA